MWAAALGAVPLAAAEPLTALGAADPAPRRSASVQLAAELLLVEARRAVLPAPAGPNAEPSAPGDAAGELPHEAVQLRRVITEYFAASPPEGKLETGQPAASSGRPEDAGSSAVASDPWRFHPAMLDAVVDWLPGAVDLGARLDEGLRDLERLAVLSESELTAARADEIARVGAAEEAVVEARGLAGAVPSEAGDLVSTIEEIVHGIVFQPWTYLILGLLVAAQLAAILRGRGGRS